MNKSLKLSTLLITILLIIIAAIALFGYYYHQGWTPFPNAPKISSNAQPQLVVTFDGGDNSLSRPLAVAPGPNGRIYVADTGNNRIVIFNARGKIIKAFGNTGTKESEFNFPSGISVSKSGKVYVTDYKNNRIQVFDLEGSLLEVFSSNSILDLNGKPLTFSPLTLVVDSNDQLYVSDSFRHRILVLNKNGKLLRVIGQEGSQPGQFLYVNGLSVDEKNKVILVSDSNNSRIQALDLNGKFLWEQQSVGKESVLAIPKGITKAGGTIYVADVPAHRIVAYDEKGKFLYSFGFRSTETDGFNFPTGLAWHQELGYLMIADRENNRIDIYK